MAAGTTFASIRGGRGRVFRSWPQGDVVRTFLQDFRYGLRAMIRSPTITAIATSRNFPTRSSCPCRSPLFRGRDLGKNYTFAVIRIVILGVVDKKSQLYGLLFRAWFIESRSHTIGFRAFAALGRVFLRGHRLPTADHRLLTTADYQIPTTAHGPPTTDQGLRTTGPPTTGQDYC